MVDYDAELFVYPQEVWDAKRCEKETKHRAKDGMGTPYPFLGYIGSNQTGQWGITRYNGGTIINDKWYQGIDRPLPIVADGFKIVHKASWGWQIIKTN